MFLTLEQIQAGFDAGEDSVPFWHRPLWHITDLRYEIDEDRFPFLPMLQICKFGDGITLQRSRVRCRAAKLLFRGIKRHALALHRLSAALRHAKKFKVSLQYTHVVAAINAQYVAQAEAALDQWMERFSVFTHRILREINERWMQIDIKALLRTLSWDVPDDQWAFVVRDFEDDGLAVPAWLQ
jgi:hypothetical protein